MNILITLCGRGGSKGILNKNIRSFVGNPLLYYTIAAAYLFKKNSADDVDISLNSDSDIILNLARQFDLTCIKRPEALAQDDTPKLYVIRHSLEYMEKEQNKKYDYVIDLDITSPLRTAEDIGNALKALETHADADVILSAVPARRNPYFNMVERNGGEMRIIIRGGFTARQQAPQVYDVNASIYCYRRDSIFHTLDKSPLDGAFDIYVMKDTGVLDLDSENDFELMEILARHYFNGELKALYDYACALKSWN